MRRNTVCICRYTTPLCKTVILPHIQLILLLFVLPWHCAKSQNCIDYKNILNRFALFKMLLLIIVVTTRLTKLGFRWSLGPHSHSYPPQLTHHKIFQNPVLWYGNCFLNNFSNTYVNS